MSRRKRKWKPRYAPIAAGKMPDKIIAMEAPVSIVAAADDGDGKPKVPTFEVVAYTGGPMEVAFWDLPVVIDLDGISYSNSLIANLDHDRSLRVGHVTKKAKTDGQLVLGGFVSAATAAANEVTQNAANGFPWQASIEAMPVNVEEVEKGQTAEANGRTFKGPLYLVRKSKLSGFAFVSHGADDNTTASIAASISAGTAKEKEMKVSKELRDFIEAMLPGVDVDTLSDQAIANLQDDFDGKSGTRKPEPVSAAESPFEKRKLELKRREEIREVADRLCEGRTYDDVVAIEKMHDHAVKAGMSPQDFKNELYEAMVIPRVTAPVRPPEAPGQKLTAGLLEAAVCQTAGLTTLEKHFSDQTLQAARDKFPNGVGLQELYLVCARANGLPERVTSQVTKEVQAYAFGNINGRQQIHASGFSTLSLPGILSNVANKFLLDGWGGGEMAWSEVAGRRPVRDFKQATSYRLSGNLKYLKVGADGEIKHGDVSETSYTAQADTFGRMFAVTRRDIINDDLGALTQVP